MYKLIINSNNLHFNYSTSMYVSIQKSSHTELIIPSHPLFSPLFIPLTRCVANYYDVNNNITLPKS